MGVRAQENPGLGSVGGYKNPFRMKPPELMAFLRHHRAEPCERQKGQSYPEACRVDIQGEELDLIAYSISSRTAGLPYRSRAQIKQPKTDPDSTPHRAQDQARNSRRALELVGMRNGSRFGRNSSQESLARIVTGVLR
jgi:hypothetical protein